MISNLIMIASFDSDFERARIMSGIMGVVITLISVAITVIVIISLISAIKNQRKISKNVFSEEGSLFKQIKEKLNSNSNEEGKEDHYTTCSYCGSRYSEDLNKCPNCGAGKKEKK